MTRTLCRCAHPHTTCRPDLETLFHCMGHDHSFLLPEGDPMGEDGLQCDTQRNDRRDADAGAVPAEAYGVGVGHTGLEEDLRHEKHSYDGPYRVVEGEDSNPCSGRRPQGHLQGMQIVAPRGGVHSAIADYWMELQQDEEEGNPVCLFWRDGIEKRVTDAYLAATWLQLRLLTASGRPVSDLSTGQPCRTCRRAVHHQEEESYQAVPFIFSID